MLDAGRLALLGFHAVKECALRDDAAFRLLKLSAVALRRKFRAISHASVCSTPQFPNSRSPQRHGLKSSYLHVLKCALAKEQGNSFDAMKTTHLKIAKLTDATDAAHLEKALEAVPRVQSVTMDPAAHEAVIEHDQADPNELTRAVKQLGYVAVFD
jgi:copper chaperone CopZ